MHIERLSIPERFRGPPRSGNGGYVCGVIAKPLRGVVAVRLKAPPPLNTELRLESTETHSRLLHAATLIGEAKSAQLTLQPPAAPSYEEAQTATRSFLGFRAHPFPGCFVCGTERSAHDGLRIFPGSLGGTSVIAAPWIPDVTLGDELGRIRHEFVWAALDCPGAFAIMPPPGDSTVVLGELCGSVEGEVSVNEPCVVIAWPLGGEGRKRFAGSAVYGAEGQLIACARAVWIEVAASGWG